MSQEILTQVIESVFAILTVLLTGVLIPKLKAWLDAKVQNVTFTNCTNELLQQVSIAVDYVQKTQVETLKKNHTFDANAQKEALETALQAVLTNLSKSALDYYQKNIGTENLSNMIVQHIEARLLNK